MSETEKPEGMQEPPLADEPGKTARDSAPVEAAINESGMTDEQRKTLIREIMAKETFIDPLDPEAIVKAYSVYDTDPSRIMKALVQSFQSYCRKCIREVALLRVKNDVAKAVSGEAEKIRNAAMEALTEQVRKDQQVDAILIRLIFKTVYWNWLLYGLKDIFNEQRRQPGNMINNQLNKRFHRLKEENNFQTVADLVLHDLTEIVNAFKSELTSGRVGIFT